MNEKDCDKFFEEWLRAYSNHLHLVRQGTRHDLVQPADSKPPLPATESGADDPRRKTTSS